MICVLNLECSSFPPIWKIPCRLFLLCMFYNGSFYWLLDFLLHCKYVARRMRKLLNGKLSVICLSAFKMLIIHVYEWFQTCFQKKHKFCNLEFRVWSVNILGQKFVAYLKEYAYLLLRGLINVFCMDWLWPEKCNAVIDFKSNSEYL